MSDRSGLDPPCTRRAENSRRRTARPNRTISVSADAPCSRAAVTIDVHDVDFRIAECRRPPARPASPASSLSVTPSPPGPTADFQRHAADSFTGRAERGACREAASAGAGCVDEHGMRRRAGALVMLRTRTSRSRLHAAGSTKQAHHGLRFRSKSIGGGPIEIG